MNKIDIDSFNTKAIKDAWKERSCWNTNFDINYNLTSVPLFISNNPDLFKKVKSVNTLFTEADKLTSKYVDWCVANLSRSGIHVNTTEEDKKDLANFYKGFIGEYFYMGVYLKYKCTKLVKSASGKFSPWAFETVVPSGVLKNTDKGMDGMYVDGHSNNGVIQVKFYNPKLNEPITKDVIDKAQREGQRYKVISQDDDFYNTLICKTGKEFPIVIRDDDFMSKEVFVMDSETVDKSLKFNESNEYFWKKYVPDTFTSLYNKLQ